MDDERDEAARKARAEQLRAEIERLTSPEGGSHEAGEPTDESPRDFIHRKMRETEEKEQPQGDPQ
jgi:hypothetical protein